MRPRHILTTVSIRAVAVALVAPVAVRAQAPRAPATLTVPVASVGACTVATTKPAFLVGITGLRGAKVVIAADQPSQRREVSLYVDRHGQPVEYDEMSYGPTVTGGTGEDVVWAKHAGSAEQAFRLRHVMTTGAAIRHERVELTAVDRKGVHAMIAWMTARCGALVRTGSAD